eukprot:gene13186-biopygen16530
MSRGGCS